MHDGEGEAGIHSTSVDVYGAGAALSVVASFFRAEQVEAFAQSIEKRDPGFERHTIIAAIDVENDGDGREISGRNGRRGW